MEESAEEWEQTVVSSRFTKYPVCDGSIDNIVGVLDTKDYFRLKDKTRKSVMEKAVRAPYFIPEGAKADITLRNMQKNRVSFGIVLDEYAGFSGVVSIKDLIERIVGDMLDEDEDSDGKEEEIQRIDEKKWRVSGNVTLTLLSKTLETEFPDDYETVSGFILGLYGEVPEDGASFEVEYEGVSIAVSDVQDHKVVSSIFTLPEKESSEEEE